LKKKPLHALQRLKNCIRGLRLILCTCLILFNIVSIEATGKALGIDRTHVPIRC